MEKKVVKSQTVKFFVQNSHNFVEWTWAIQINHSASQKNRQITQQTSRRPVQNSNIGVAGNSNFEDDDDFFNNVDMPEDVSLKVR